MLIKAIAHIAIIQITSEKKSIQNLPGEYVEVDPVAPPLLVDCEHRHDVAGGGHQAAGREDGPARARHVQDQAVAAGVAELEGEVLGKRRLIEGFAHDSLCCGGGLRAF